MKKIIKKLLKRIKLFETTLFFLNYIKKQKNKLSKKIASNKSKKIVASIQRIKREKCWCGGIINIENHPHKNYGVCKKCGTHTNIFPVVEKDLSKLYSLEYYWNTRQKSLGHPNIKNREKNDIKDGRIEYWLKLINKYYTRKNGIVLEVGCAHGILLKKLKNLGYKCIGVEVDKKTAEWTQDKTGIKILHGIFPFLDVPQNNIFIASDVIEHSNSPKEFINKIDEKLTKEGVAFIQTPILLNSSNFLENTKSDLYKAVYNDLEHLFILTEKSINLLLQGTSLKIEYLGNGWKFGHELLILRKK